MQTNEQNNAMAVSIIFAAYFVLSASSSENNAGSGTQYFTN
jgi:hypothetical protein